MKKLIRNLVFILTPLFLLLVVSEGASRLYDRFHPHLNEYEALIESQGFTPFNKKSGEKRIFILGESAVRGVPYTLEYSMSGFLSKLLADSGHSNVKVINLGVPGRHSFYQYEARRVMARYGADIVILYAGNNDTRDFSNVLRDVPWAWLDFKLSWNSSFYAELKRRIGSFRKSVNKRFHKKIFYINYNQDDVWHWTDVYIRKKTAYHENPHLGFTRKRRAVQDYEHNLEGLVRYLSENKIKVYISELPLVHRFLPAVSDMKKNVGPNGKSYEAHEKILFKTTEEERAWRGAYGAGLLALKQKDFERALQYFEKAKSINDEYALLHHWIGECYFGLGRYEEAKSSFVRGIDWQIQSSGGDTFKNQVLKNLADRHHLPWMNVQAVLESASPHGVLGQELFLDHCHPTMVGHKLIASTFMASLCQTGALACEGGRSEWKYWFERLSAGGLSPENMAREYLLTGFYLFNGSGWNTQPQYRDAIYYFEKAREVSPQNSEVYPFLAACYWNTGAKDKSREVLTALRQMNPGKYQKALSDFPYLAGSSASQSSAPLGTLAAAKG